MSKIIPFKALLPDPKFVSDVICPPYDIISSDGAREFASGNPRSFLHVTRSEIDLPKDQPPYEQVVYDKAKENLKAFQDSGLLVEQSGSFYIYRQVMNGHTQTGLVCAASVDEYANGKIKKHELTRQEKVDDRAKHSITLHAHSEPVFLVHETSKEISEIMTAETASKPLYDVTDPEGVRHIFWRTSKNEELRSAFGKLDALYIADGHHRSQAALITRNKMRDDNPKHNGSELYNFFPVVIFPADEVNIFEYNWQGAPSKRPLSRHKMADIIKCADNGNIMPPKSTWFAPKLKSGFFVYVF